MDPTLALRLFIDHLDLARTRNVEGLTAIYHPEVDYFDPIGGRVTTRDALVPYLISLCSLYDVLEVEVRNVWIHNERAAIEWRQTAIRDGHAAFNRGMTIAGARDGRLFEHRDFFTLGRPEWAERLRAETARPPGSE